MFIGYSIRSNEATENLLQETIRRASECNVPVRPGRFPGLTQDSKDTSARAPEKTRVEFFFYADAAVLHAMAELYLKWKAAILLVDTSVACNDVSPFDVVNLGKPTVVGLINDSVVDAWELSKVYPHSVHWSYDSKEGRGLLQLWLVSYVDEVEVSLTSPLEQLLDLEQSGVLTQ